MSKKRNNWACSVVIYLPGNLFPVEKHPRRGKAVSHHCVLWLKRNYFGIILITSKFESPRSPEKKGKKTQSSTMQLQCLSLSLFLASITAKKVKTGPKMNWWAGGLIQSRCLSTSWTQTLTYENHPTWVSLEETVFIRKRVRLLQVNADKTQKNLTSTSTESVSCQAALCLPSWQCASEVRPGALWTPAPATSMDSLSANFFLWDSLCFEVFSEFQLFAQGWMGIDEGWIFGEWETGPWLGFRLSFFLQQLSNIQLFVFFQLPYTYILCRLCNT